jgi:Sec-independent protein translocase protein TatA
MKKLLKAIKEIKQELKELENDWKLAQQGEYDMIENEYVEAKFDLLEQLEELQSELEEN